MAITELLQEERGETQDDPNTEAKSATREVNITVSDHAYKILERLAKQKNTTISEVLGHALALEKRVDEEIANGGRILVERNGEFRELMARQGPDVAAAIRPPLRQGRFEPFEDKIEILDETKYEEVMSQLRR